MGGTQSVLKNDASKDPNDFNDEDPIEEVHVLNDNLSKWQKDAIKRMKNVSVTVTKLQTKLEDLDEYHAQAQEQAMLIQQQDRTEVDKAMERINSLQQEVQKTKMELSQKNVVMEELRKESERLLTERDEVRKQKETWQKMIDEVKEQKLKIEKRESELQTNHKKLLELHETLSEEKKKLHKKAKKIKAREKRLNALRNVQTQSYVQPQSNFNHMVPSSNGSDYAESELTYFSDGDTEIASVNSISDDESQDNFHKQQMQALKQ